MYTSLWLNRLYFYVICHWWVKTSSKQFLISGLPYCNKPLCLALFRCQRTWQSLLTKSTSQRTSVMGRITRQLKVTRQVRMNRQGHRSSHPSGHGTLSAQSSSKSRTVEPLMNDHPHLRPIFFIDGMSTLYKRSLTNDHPADVTNDHGNLNFTPDERPSDRWPAHLLT